MAELAHVIGGPPPAEFDALPDADRAALAALVRRAAEHRDRQIDRAIDDSLRRIPALLRGTVKRALGM
jgi:hypothetical protein